MKNIYLLFSTMIIGIGAVKAQYSDLYDFNGTLGKNPISSVVISGNVLYGTTDYGGANSDGVLYSINADGTGYADLHDFNGTNGESPASSLLLSGTVLYGMTDGNNANGGNIYSFNTSGSVYTDMHDFTLNGTKGSAPQGSLTISGSVLYGMTYWGGANGDGCIFSINTSGTGYVDIYDFTGATGKNPSGSLTLSGSTLYGMTINGGANGKGCAFSISTSGTGYADLLDFKGTNGANPYGSLILSATGNVLYGMTSAGGSAVKDSGTVFSINTNGSHYKDILDFNGTNGANPQGTLMLSGSTLYGMAMNGGKNKKGVIFSIDTSGTGYADLYDFNGTNGANPYYSSLTHSAGILYGTAFSGGAMSDGVVFSYNTNVSCKADLTTGLVAQYDFTGNANDISGNLNNGTDDGATLTTNRFGSPNTAYSFNGSDSIIVPNSTSLQFTNNQSVSFWLKVPSLPNPANNNEGIIEKLNQNLPIDNTGNSAQGFMIGFSQLGNGNIFYGARSGSSSGSAGTFISGTLLSANKWEYVVFTFNSSKDSVYAYLNGTKVNSALIPIGTTIGQNTLPLLIGTSAWMDNGVFPYSFTGILDDIRIYNTALTVCDVDSIFNLPNPLTTGISNLSIESGIKAFPNPSNGNLTMNYEVSSASAVVIELFDLIGGKVKSILNSTQQSGSYQMTVDMGDLNNGIYLLKGMMNGGMVTERIVLMK